MFGTHLTGGLFSAINPVSDGGVTFVGSTTALDIQKSVGVTRSSPGNSYVNIIGSKFQSKSTAMSYPIRPLASKAICLMLMDRSGITSISLRRKIYPSSMAVHINIQTIFPNAFNHPEWIVNGNFSTRSSIFGLPTRLPRRLVASTFLAMSLAMSPSNPHKQRLGLCSAEGVRSKRYGKTNVIRSLDCLH